MKSVKIAAVGIADMIWFTFMTYLSHQNGEATAATSRKLMRTFRFLDERHVDVVNNLTRRGAHVFCFVVLTVLTLTLLRLANRHVWIGFLMVLVWCFLDEWTKRTIPGRHYSTFDVMLNVVGVMLGWMIWRIGCRWIDRKKK